MMNDEWGRAEGFNDECLILNGECRRAEAVIFNFECWILDGEKAGGRDV